MLHQTGVTDMIDPAAGGYAGLKGCGGIVQPGVSVLDPGQANPGVVGSLGNLSLAVDVAVSPDHQKVALAVAGNDAVQGPTVVEQPLRDRDGLAAGPVRDDEHRRHDHPAAGPGGRRAPTRRRACCSRRRASPPRSGARTPARRSALASDSRADTGHFIFHVNAGGGLACASCHPEGGEDGRVWNFVCTGARRTQSIRGGISDTAPFHWDGSELDFSRLMDDVFSGRMAGPQLGTDQKTALQGWIDTIPAMPATAGLDAAAVARGKAVFTDPRSGARPATPVRC